jgi:nucleoside-diphosphate-sugar epimerase
MIESKTIVLTGGTGFLGSNLLKSFLAANYNILLLKRTTSDVWRIRDVIDSIHCYDIDAIRLEEVFSQRKIDSIVHCATDYGRKAVDQISLLEANLILPLKLLQLGSTHNVSSFINTDTILDKRVSHYSLSKSQFKDWLKAYSAGMTCVNVALEHFYGPYDDESKFVTYIIQSILKRVDRIDLTKGEQKRDFIFIDDVVDAFMRISSHCPELGKGYFHYEIGSTRTIEIREFVEMVKRQANNTKTLLNFGALPYRENEVMESHVDIGAIQRLGWRPSVALEDGLRTTIALERGRLSL